MKVLPGLLVVLGVAACSSTTSTGTTGSGAGTGDGTSPGLQDGGIPVTPTGSFSISFGPVTVPPGVERTQCITTRLGNPNAIHVGTFHNVLTNASHHLVIYRVKDTVEKTTPYDCQPFTDTLDPAKGAPLMITQKKDETLQLPPGVAYTLEANQMMRIEVHYINPGDKDVSLSATSIMTPIADADYHDEADFLFIGNPDISLPPNAKTTLGPSFFQVPAEYAGVKFFALTGHTHHLGTNVQISIAANKNDTGQSVYDIPNWSWAEPETKRADPAFTIPQGGGFRFSCDWNNTTNATVSFGESANAEMCFFWAYYYPSKGAKVCFHTKRLGSEVDQCCPGSAICQFF